MKPKLLLCEDHPGMRELVASLLEDAFDVIASVANGRAAVEAASKLLPDILVLDVSLPILDGTDVARRLKAQGCKAKIVFISVSRDIDQVTACLAEGGDAYVSKVRMGTDLVYAIAEVLAGRTFISPPETEDCQ